MVVVKVFRDGEQVQLPEYKTEGSSGFDLRSITEVSIHKYGTILIPTGLYFEIPKGYEIQIRSRSGLALTQGLIVLNQPGTVDSDYRGEIKVILHNISSIEEFIRVGDRIAQAVLCPIFQAEFEEVSFLDKLEDSTRGEGGFGSTGKG